uniref:PiggyBac transposable element-derived protein domain-containing protein n=1 Tax=Octopus bimaculoides TaxID=37653 RepID=A0A0L8FWG2_OCTBM
MSPKCKVQRHKELVPGCSSHHDDYDDDDIEPDYDSSPESDYQESVSKSDDEPPQPVGIVRDSSSFLDPDEQLAVYVGRPCDTGLIEHICTDTSRYATVNHCSTQQSHSRKWVDVTPDELDLFLSLVILMGMYPKPDMKLYWTRNPVLQTPFFYSMMPHDQFEQILHNL